VEENLRMIMTYVPNIEKCNLRICKIAKEERLMIESANGIHPQVPKYVISVSLFLRTECTHNKRREKSNSPSLEDQQKLPTILLPAHSNPSDRYKIS
jgi:hypothetical protein